MWLIKSWQFLLRFFLAASLLGCGPSATKVSPGDAARIREEGKRIIEESRRKQAEEIQKALKRQNADSANKLAQKLQESQTDGER